MMVLFLKDKSSHDIHEEPSKIRRDSWYYQWAGSKSWSTQKLDKEKIDVPNKKAYILRFLLF